MAKNELTNNYLDWLYRLVYDKGYIGGASYRTLFSRLHSVKFTYTIGMDENRAFDGIALRYQFGCGRRLSQATIEKYLDNSPCSVLEMTVALALKCEEHIMNDPNQGDRTGKWFWGIMNNLKLMSMTDDKFDAQYADSVIFKLLNREFEPNGEGGLFTVRNCNRDLRTVEIWYQMCYYLNDILT